MFTATFPQYNFALPETAVVPGREKFTDFHNKWQMVSCNPLSVMMFSCENIYFHGNHLNCNCSFLWFILWLNERPLTKVYGFCSSFNNTTVGELAPDNFTFCYENNAKPMKCNILHPIEIMCTSRYITSYFKHWVHTKNGIEIRKLTGQFIDEDTNVLSIAFCSYEDVGDYTCVRTTNYSALTETALLTMKLSVYAAPIVLNKHMTEVGYDLVLSVVFYCDPYREPDWLLGDKVLSNGSEYIVSTCPYQVSLNQQLRRTYAGFISSLTILSYIQRPSTTYTCRINNEFGEVKEMMISRSVNIEIPRTIFCNTATTAEMKCTLDFSEAIPDLWIHSSGGQVIRSLQGTVVNNTNILILPFCNYQDMGDYMCTWRTSVPDLFFNKTITLVVNGSPILLKQFISMDGRDKVLSVLFFSQPFPTEPNWYFHGAPVLLGYDYQQTSVFSTVTVRQHRQDVIKQGFVSNLTIVNFKPQLHGDFTCKIVNDFGYLLLDFDVNEDPNDISHTDSSTIIIVSTCVFSIIVLTIIITVGVCKCRKRTKDRNMDPPLPSSSVPDVYDSIRLSRLEDTENAYLDAY